MIKLCAEKHLFYSVSRVKKWGLKIDMQNLLLSVGLLMTSASSFAEVAPSWSDVPLEKRCEGFLEFMNATSKIELPEWKITKATCLAEGSVVGEISWSFDASWQKGTKALPLRYQITEVQKLKGQVQWCVVKGKNAGCSAPWEHSFAKGKLYKNAKEAKAAYDGVKKISNGFANMSLKLDEWVSKKGGEVKIYGLTYPDWVKAWVTSPRSLPVNKEIVTAEFSLDKSIPTVGFVKFAPEIPQALRDCLGCGKTSCEKSPIVFSFTGLGLTMTRELTAEEQQTDQRKSASVSWVVMEATPFVNKEPKWPMLCGEHRFNIQKL